MHSKVTNAEPFKKSLQHMLVKNEEEEEKKCMAPNFTSCIAVLNVDSLF